MIKNFIGIINISFGWIWIKLAQVCKLTQLKFVKSQIQFELELGGFLYFLDKIEFWLERFWLGLVHELVDGLNWFEYSLWFDLNHIK